jgi:hypothetical protein
MPDTPLDDRLARYGVALDEARRRGVVRERQSLLRRLTPVLWLGAAVAALIAAMVIIPRNSAEQPLAPAQRVEAEKEIREAFEVWLDPQSPEEGRRSVRERGRDDAEELRRETQWTLVGERVVALRLRVTEVELVDRTTAFVDLRGGGSEMFAATATKQGNTWRVAYATACAVGNAVGRTCDPDEFLTDEQQRIGQPFVDVPSASLSDDDRVAGVERGEEVRDQLLAGVNRHRQMLSAPAVLLAVRHRPGDATALVWWTIGTVQPGVAVFDGRSWKMSRETWCKLSQNAGEFPPACGSGPISTLPTSVPSVDPFDFEVDGSLVRGTQVAFTLTGLDRLRGREVELAISDALPSSHLYSREDQAARLIGGVVGPDGALVVRARVPNWLVDLDGNHGISAIEPGREYLLFVTVGDTSTIWYQAPIRFAGAELGAPYEVQPFSSEGSRSCGAPPVALQFDGRNWAPDDPTSFQESSGAGGTPSHDATYPGTMVLTSASVGRFTGEDGFKATFSEVPGWSC